MRKLTWLLLLLLTLAGGAEAGQVEAPRPGKRWDAAITVAAAEVRPLPNDARSYDNWFLQGRYAVQFGGYWTAHIKTEFEYATFGEGSIFLQEYQRLPGVPYDVPYTRESIHQLNQLQARLTWQFGDNAWVHPYVSGGVFGSRDNSRYYTGAPYVPSAVGLVELAGHETAPSRADRFDAGFVAAAGAKIYFAPHGFLNTGVNWTHGRQRTFNMFAGLGIDF